MMTDESNGTPPHRVEERLDFLFLSLVGQVVVVHTVDGEATEGLFASRSEDGASIQLVQTRNLCTKNSGPTSASKTHEVLRIAMDSVVWVDMPSVRLEAAATGQVERFQGQNEKMDWAAMPMDDEGDNFEEEARNHKPGSFNQFDVNAQKFGVKSTYDENMYTTKLVKSKLTAEQIKYAERTAEEIEKSTARGGIQHQIERGEDVDVDEGDLYSNVQRQQQPPERANAKGKPANPRANNSAPKQTSASPTGQSSLNINAQAWTAPAAAVVSSALQEIASKVDRSEGIPSVGGWGNEVDPYGMEDREDLNGPRPLNHHQHQQYPQQQSFQHHHIQHHHQHQHHVHHHQQHHMQSMGMMQQPLPQPSFHNPIAYDGSRQQTMGHGTSPPPNNMQAQQPELPQRVAPTRGGMSGGMVGRPTSVAQPQQPVSSAAPPTKGNAPTRGAKNVTAQTRHEDPVPAPQPQRGKRETK